MAAPDRSHRLGILGIQEVNELFARPRFEAKDRDLYFELSPEELAIVVARRDAVGVYFVLMLGYFRARSQFFDLAADASREDLEHIVGRYFPHLRDKPLPPPPSRPTLQALQEQILEGHGFRRWTGDVRRMLVSKLGELAMRATEPRSLFREALQYLERESIVRPSYPQMQDLIGEVISQERERLLGRLRKSLTDPIKKRLDALLASDGSAYRIGLLKKDLKDFSYGALTAELERRAQFAPLHAFAQAFLQAVDISQENSKYYASMVRYYTASRLRQMPPLAARLYVLCFAYHRFRQVNDQLIEAFLARVEGYGRDATSASEEAMKKALEEGLKGMHGAGDVLALFLDPQISDKAWFRTVRDRAFEVLPKERLGTVADMLREIAFDKAAYQWSVFDQMAATIRRNLRPVFVALDFVGRTQNEPLLRAVAFFKQILAEGQSPRQVNPKQFPIDFIPRGSKRFLFLKGEDGKRALVVDRYEIFLYQQLTKAAGGGHVFVRESNEFKPFEDDLIGDERWKSKEAILDALDAPILKVPIEQTLAELRKELEEKYAQVNARIKSKENAHFNLRGKTTNRWTLGYPAEEAKLDGGFYAQLPVIDVAELLRFVARETGFRANFTHVLTRNAKQAPDPALLDASIFGMGSNMGLLKMAEVAGLKYSSLATTARNFLREETLRAANDTIVNATAKLPAFALFNVHDRLHSSSDGQKFETKVSTYKARHSPKYFGMKKGIVACTIVANHVPIAATVIGAHEHESHFVFDLIFNNSSEVQPERHSTDTHGTNQVNFFTLHTYGYRFAPRYRDVQKKVETMLVGFHPPKHYGDALIKPSRKVKEDLIIAEWPNIVRIMASLGQREVTQSTIIRKLSSYELQNDTKLALWELDSLYRTLYILEYIDDVELRQCVQKVLNRGEAYHKFRRAIAYVNEGKFRVATEAEQKIWNECARLIANAVIYYNTALLSRIYENKLAEGDVAAIELLKRVSPVAWRNVNLYGAFEFIESGVDVDLDLMAQRFGDPSLWGVVTSNVESGVFD